MRPLRILLSEGSSLSAREAVTALGLAGHAVDVCDPDPLCLGRFSRFVHRWQACPPFGRDVHGYLRFLFGLLETGHYDVLFPAHEQAFLFSRARDALSRRVGLAVPDFSVFASVQSKVGCARLLDELLIPQPRTRVIRTAEEVPEAGPFPFYIKADLGTASTQVWRVAGPDDLPAALEELRRHGLLDGQGELLVQEAAPGKLERAQMVFDLGRLVAWHGYAQRSAGPGGGDAAKTSVPRRAVRDHVARLGAHLRWHGAISFDYLFDEGSGRLAFIDCNPRLVEPVNACLAGVNLADVLVRVSLGEQVPTAEPGREGVRTHLTLMAFLEAARRRHRRTDLLRCLAQVVLGRGPFRASREELTPALRDPLSALPLAFVLARLLASPAAADDLVAHAVGAYSLTPEAARAIEELDPSTLAADQGGRSHLALASARLA
jgi:predicted ATP-grasp superfamily ATP-dependent carboligase